jgi:hypothetical protein
MTDPANGGVTAPPVPPTRPVGRTLAAALLVGAVSVLAGLTLSSSRFGADTPAPAAVPTHDPAGGDTASPTAGTSDAGTSDAGTADTLVASTESEAPPAADPALWQQVLGDRFQDRGILGDPGDSPCPAPAETVVRDGRWWEDPATGTAVAVTVTVWDRPLSPAELAQRWIVCGQWRDADAWFTAATPTPVGDLPPGTARDAHVVRLDTGVTVATESFHRPGPDPQTTITVTVAGVSDVDRSVVDQVAGHLRTLG